MPARKHHIRAVLFDLDGVVAFTDKYHYQAWKRLAGEQDWEFDWEINHACRGIPRMASLQVILDHNKVEISPAEKEELAARKNRYYAETLRNVSGEDLYPGVVAFLEKLRAEGVKLGLCSSSRNALTVLKALELEDCFGTVVTGNDLTRAKPDPQIFLLGADRLRVPPFHCLVFEDAASGIEAGLAAGMKCIGVGKPEQLPNAPEIVETYEEIDVQALLDTGRPQPMPAEPWAVTETEIRPRRLAYWETVFALSNGLIGWRGSLEEEDERTRNHSYPALFLNGLYGYKPYEHIWKFPGYPESLHAMLNWGDWGVVNLRVDDVPFSPFTGEISAHRRSLNLQKGFLRRSFVWKSPNGRRVAVKTWRLASMTLRHRAALRYEVTPLDDCVITIESKVRLQAESKALPGPQIEILKVERGQEADSALLKARNGPFQVGMAVAHDFRHDKSAEFFKHSKWEDNCLVHVCEIRAAAGRPVALEKHLGVHTSVETPAGELAARAAAAAVKSRREGFGPLLRQQEDFWAGYWKKADIRIDGPAADQQAARWTLFHLRQSHPENDTRSIGANSLTGDKYCGHVFWDTEMYIAPQALYTEPRLVRSLLMYRYNLLDRARERARQMGGPGALYSWNSISGEECGVVFEAATAEYHLLNAIAFAIDRYVRQTGDQEFLYDYGAEILFETSRFLADLGGFVPRRGNRFRINSVCGPDEYACGVNNNCYTNVMTQWHFRYAAEVCGRMKEETPDRFTRLVEKIGLKEDEPAFWRRAADAMYIPFDEEWGIHAQDDSFLNLEPADMEMIPQNTDIREMMHPLNLWRLQVAKQADVVLLMFVQGHQFSPEIKRANYEFYEPRTCHGSSLSACMHAILAAETGREEDAWRYFRQSARMDLNDFKNNTGGGVHSACLGGTWMAVVNGFAGMRDEPEGLRFAPMLPDNWRGYGFQIVHRGRRLAVEVKTGQVTYRLLEGEEMEFASSGQVVRLTAGESAMRIRL